MKRCAKCGAEYDDSYDGCPDCAAKVAAGDRSAVIAKGIQSIGCLIVIGVLLFCFLASWFGGR